MKAFMVALTWEDGRGALSLNIAETEAHSVAGVTAQVMREERMDCGVKGVMAQEITADQLRMILREIEGEPATAVLKLVDAVPEGAA